MKQTILVISLLTYAHLTSAQAPEIAWQVDFGGSLSDGFGSIGPTTDGGFIVGGSSGSGISGNKTDSCRGGFDYWILKLDSLGEIEWQKVYGGDQDDILEVVVQTADGGYILGGTSASGVSGEKNEPAWPYFLDGSNSADYWIVKIDPVGNIQWQNTIGGNSYDNLRSLNETQDGGYIVGGESYSNANEDKSEDVIGATDFWILKLDATGNIVWQNTIGGFNWDDFAYIEPTEDGGYIAGGYSSSIVSGDKTEASLGSFDYWIMKLDSIGNILWQNVIGGDLNDYLTQIHECTDGGFIISGYAQSGISGDKTEPCYGGTVEGSDYWVIKTDSIGNIVWQNTLGGAGDDVLYSIIQTIEGGYVLGGYSRSDSCADKHENGVTDNPLDFWVVKLSPFGLIEWENTIGGDIGDFLYSVFQTPDGGFIAGGTSYSPISGDKTEELYGVADYWLVKLFCVPFTSYLDGDGDGFGNAFADSMSCTIPLGYVLDSTDCDDFDPFMYPGADEIADSLDNNCNGIIDEGIAVGIVVDQMVASRLAVFPNPSTGAFTVTTKSDQHLSMVISNISGQVVFKQIVKQEDGLINESFLLGIPAGLYFIHLFSDELLYTGRLIIQ